MILGEEFEIKTFCRSYEDAILVNENYLEWMFSQEGEDIWDDLTEGLIDSCKVMQLASDYEYTYLGDFPGGSFFHINLEEFPQEVYGKYFSDGYQKLLEQFPINIINQGDAL